jgi:hypothetical protein
MEESTTSDAGVAEATQPAEPGAVSLGEKGAPTLRPNVAPTSSPQSQVADEPAATETPTTEETQPETKTQEAPAESADDGFAKFAQAKGFDPADLTDRERKALEMARASEQRMHEATAKSRELETTMASNPNLAYTGDQNYDQLALEVNNIKIQNRVNDFFNANPEARSYETKMAEIVQQRPHLQNDLDALYALAVNSPDRQSELKQEGGRQALTNLAQKQSAVPPVSNATTGATSSQERITPDNVDQLVAQHDLAWFTKHKAEIDRAMAGTR